MQITIYNVPETLAADLKNKSKSDRRSLSAEAIYLLELTTNPEKYEELQALVDVYRREAKKALHAWPKRESLAPKEWDYEYTPKPKPDSPSFPKPMTR
jgi:hypothetical protein